ncbi:PREDICTED: uncharacterized protein LOC109584176 isoform X2 [Amphimedon queenslandica]|uniref:Uncharacterized protein n=1 Tax=Amphimedon queenslandica TaxID=400682 RepID=A0AAN0JED2_AMPQE|nr:PREDICTED: uncharacterized protein LOC109584176 isoform X2 [Amphimedon queenslandica]|eukprot:XP_019855349.1 PREDICTED: uncharacterized protein LOC109584176 isoform X2 [Amphimedon queenslandica]
MDHEVPVSIQQAPVSDYEVPVSSNPSYSDHVPLSTNNNQLLATPVTTNPSYQSVTTPSVELETEYYDTFDANKICTKSNTSYLPVNLKATTTTVSPSVHIKRTNKRIRSYFNEELTNWEYILASLATLTVLITVIVIILLSLLMYRVVNNSTSSSSSLTTIASNHSTNNRITTKDTSGPNCTTCTNNNINTSSLTAIRESISFISEEINKLMQDKNMSTSDVLKQLNDYMYQIKIINESLQSLIPESNKPRVPTLTGLNLTSSITINHGDCVVSNTTCNTFINPFLDLIQACQLPILHYANETHIIVSSFGRVTPIGTGQFNSSTIIQQVQASVDEMYFSNDTIVERLRKSSITPLCFSYNFVPVRCEFYYTYCTYQSNFPNSILFVH